ncbi:MAG: energy-coupling factor transporter transmembrane protein EcfT [Clostridium sp.]|nr:energy-coupling factor transporter transmembrane protein EcfT [Clostridium sp.]MCM1547322.1 energy-coupling factor transporter transmembrane protein EcfT [Ruminococcus sp.]
MCFSGSHPLALFIYFSVVICSAVLDNNPYFLILSLFAAFIYRALIVKNPKVLREALFYVLLTLALTVVLPLFSHNGQTPLFFLNNNAVTKETAFRGFGTGVQISAILCWLSCMSNLMSGDKIIYLISKISSRAAVFLSRLMRFLPMMKRQFKSIHKTQTIIHMGKKNFWYKIYIMAISVSALITWSIEIEANASDSMYARGYGLRGRTSYNSFHFRKIDKTVIIMALYTLPFTILSAVTGAIGVTYYPGIIFPDFSLITFLIYALWTVVLLIPFTTEICEEYRWKLLRSKI